jgi:hypothetical protein
MYCLEVISTFTVYLTTLHVAQAADDYWIMKWKWSGEKWL